MPEQIIIPRQSFGERLKREVSAFSPNVKAALIAAGVALIGMIGGCAKVYSDNSALRAKVHDLEQEIAPFKNLAVQEFRSADATSMKKLAELMVTLKNDYSNQLKEVNGLRAEIEQLKKAAPTRRRVSQVDGNEIVAKLKLTGIKSATVHTQSEDIDTKELATIVAQLFAVAGIQPTLSPVMGYFAHGVRVVLKDPKNTKLQEAFKPLFETIGESPIFQENSALDGTTVHVYVGAAFSR